MYCTNCGNKLEGGEYCPNCGMKIAPISNVQPQISNNTIKSSAPKNINKKNMFVVIGSVVALLLLILVLTEGKSNDDNTSPNYSAPYYNTQGLNTPSSDYSYYYSDNTDDYSYDTYDYSNTSQTCTACYGSGSCSICNGTGQYSMYGNDLSECTACYGTGDCSICGGDGVY